MATKVGTGVTGTADAAAGTIASAAKSTTTGNALIAVVKWEEPLVTLSSLADTAGNTWVIAGQREYGTTSEPSCAVCYAANITANASNVVTATFSGATATYRRIIVEEFSGLATSSIEDGTEQTAEGTTTSYATADITTTTTGLVVLGVAEYGALSGISGTPGVPDFTIGADAGDCFFAYLISGSAQTVTPAATATGGGSRFVAVAQAFKDGASSGSAALSGSAGTTGAGTNTPGTSVAL